MLLLPPFVPSSSLPLEYSFLTMVEMDEDEEGGMAAVGEEESRQKAWVQI